MDWIKGIAAGIAVLALWCVSLLLSVFPWAIAIALGLFIFRSCGG